MLAVCVFSGADVPCIVRRRPNLDEGKGPIYDLVGACYVAGIMHGELKRRDSPGIYYFGINVSIRDKNGISQAITYVLGSRD